MPNADVSAMGVHIARAPGGYLFEAPGKNGVAVNELLAQQFAVFTRVTLEVNIALHTYAFTVGDDVRKTGSLNETWTPTAL